MDIRDINDITVDHEHCRQQVYLILLTSVYHRHYLFTSGITIIKDITDFAVIKDIADTSHPDMKDITCITATTGRDIMDTPKTRIWTLRHPTHSEQKTSRTSQVSAASRSSKITITSQKPQISRILWPWTSHLFSTAQSFSRSRHSHLRHQSSRTHGH